VGEGAKRVTTESVIYRAGLRGELAVVYIRNDT